MQNKIFCDLYMHNYTHKNENEIACVNIATNNLSDIGGWKIFERY